MSGPPPRPRFAPSGSSPSAPRAPSPDGLRLIVSGLGYLALLAAYLLVTGIAGALGGLSVPDRLVDDRDLVALFGWVGLTISGVSTIIVPNHVGRQLRPRVLPRVHLVLSNVGLLGFFVAVLAGVPAVIATAFLLLVVASFLAFALGAIATLVPFLRSPGRRLPVVPVPAPPEWEG